jgi:hypothetical protein
MSNSEEPVIVIHMEGGIIQQINATSPIKILVADYDIDGIEESRIVSINGEGATLNLWESDQTPDYVEFVCNVFEEREKETTDGSQQLP